MHALGYVVYANGVGITLFSFTTKGCGRPQNCERAEDRYPAFLFVVHGVTCFSPLWVFGGHDFKCYVHRICDQVV